MFSTKLQVSIAAIDSALISMASELQGFAGAFVLFQGTLAPITAALVSNAFNGTNISNIKIAIGSIDLNIAVIRQQVADLLLIIQAENALVTALAKPIGQYAVSLITGCANILTEAKKQVMIATKSQIASTLIVNTTISAFTTKFQATYSETIVAPIISATIQTCDGYSFNIGNNLDTIVSGFDSLVFRYLDPKAEAPLFLNGSYSQLAVISDNATTFQEYLLSALTINTPLARSCVAKFAPQAVSILTATSTQFDGCVKLAIAFFQNEEKAVENNLNAVRTKALNYIASMTSCMTPATGTAFDRGVVVNCIQAVSLSFRNLIL